MGTLKLIHTSDSLVFSDLYIYWYVYKKQRHLDINNKHFNVILK